MKLELAQLLKRTDAGERISDVAVTAGVTTGRIYAILRKHRPERDRAARTRTSMIPAKILALNKLGTKPSRIAELLGGISRQYVHKVIADAGE